ncbi:PREDICTED: signal transducer and activator of transcription 2-like [Nanorana parkeri]|uniref:signal transducer and activator of transcription 2-like n=1 Tax=Nanorana parkeri TaxID=125878 RepID=UPI00085431A5|nr:PREDICTED: signal transducer and activator of transcription 2-like [Nanorana parkeri]
MSQWESLLKLTGQFQDNLMGLYSEELLPVEVRQYLAAWIESQDWKLAARDQSLASVHFQNLLEHLDMQYSYFSMEQNILQTYNFRRFKHDMQSRYQEKPKNLAEQIRDILQQEKQILVESQEMEIQNGQVVQEPVETGKQYEIDQRVRKVKERIQSVDQEVKFLEEQQEMFDFRYQMFQRELQSGKLQDNYIKLKTQEVQVQLNELDRKRKDVLSQIRELLGLCETLHGFLLEELNDWLRRQKLACIGADANTCLKNLEGWMTKTAEVFFHLRRLLHLLSELSKQLTYENDPLKTEPQTLQYRLNEMLHSLLQISFVVDRQPIMLYPCRRALVLKTSTQFSVRARLLVNLNELKHNVKVSYKIDKNPPNIKGFRKFNLLGPVEKSLEDVQREGLLVDYKHLTLKEQKAGGGGKGGKGATDGALCVMEELHNITFTTNFDYEGVKLTLEAVTLPFVVISNLSQFTGAWSQTGTVSCSRGRKDLTFFSNPPAAPWSLLANALSWQFSCCTERGLNPDQLQMLEKKLCGSVSKEENAVTWVKFSKENMPRASFTFWVWFDAIVMLVTGHMKNIWKDGHVMGFVSRGIEDSLLKTMQQGTFLLRFSESMRDGGITCSWVDHQQDGSYSIRSVQPYTKRELSHIPLTEIIRNYQLLAEENIPENPLKYLYPNIPKDEAFGKYYEQRSELTLEYQKYLKRRLIIVSERNIDDSQSSIASGTPQHFAETPQYDPGTPMHDSDPFQNSLDMDLNNLIDGFKIEDLLMDHTSDPMFSGPQVESSELLHDSFNAYQ